MIAYSGKQLSVAAALCWLTLTGSSALAQGGTGGSPPDEAKPAEVARPANDLHTFNVRDFGAAGDGKINDTSAITEAIQAANQSGGGEVSFPSGTYITGTFDLLSNVTLNLQVGAVLMGSGDVAD